MVMFSMKHLALVNTILNLVSKKIVLHDQIIILVNVRDMCMLKTNNITANCMLQHICISLMGTSKHSDITYAKF